MILIVLFFYIRPKIKKYLIYFWMLFKILKKNCLLIVSILKNIEPHEISRVKNIVVFNFGLNSSGRTDNHPKRVNHS